MLKGLLISLGILVLVGLLVLGCKATRAGYESPKYRLVKSEGRYQVRDYPALVLAEASTKAGKEGMDKGFGKLFRFITGGNAATQKIAMTTPVFMREDPTNASMAFVMPRQLDLNNLPRPADEAVVLRRREPGRYAVLRFSGSRSGEAPATASEQLAGWVKDQGYEPLAEPIFAYYDPPWIPGFLRRNEALLQIKAE